MSAEQRLDQIVQTAHRVIPTDVGTWASARGRPMSPAEAVVIAPADLMWLIERARADDNLRAERDALAAAVDRVRRRHPRGDEEDGLLAPGLWCPTCGHERADGGYGGCPDRNALNVPESSPS